MKYLLLLLLLVGCQEKIEPAVTPGEVFYLPPVEWRVVSQETLSKEYVAAGKVITADQRLEGFIGHRPDGTVVIYTKVPRTVDDQATCTLGHELMHEALGAYHK